MHAKIICFQSSYGQPSHISIIIILAIVNKTRNMIIE